MSKISIPGFDHDLDEVVVVRSGRIVAAFSAVSSKLVALGFMKESEDDNRSAHPISVTLFGVDPPCTP